MATYDEQDEVVVRETPKWLAPVAAAALIVGVISLGWSLYLQSHLSAAETSLAAANQQNAVLAQKLDDTNARLRAQGQALGQSMGMTQKQLEDKSDELMAQQQTTLAETARLQREQKATEQKVGAVQSDVSSVKSDVGGVKTDVAATQADLADTKTQLTRVIGDAGVMSGLIATNHDQLEELKRKGERNYYEFTLQKGAPAKNVGTIKIELKKVDPKRSKYSLMVSADDKNIEKKDKTLDEPVQFYSGKSPALFEIVVNNVSKNQVTGYLSTPKDAPQPIAVP
jgi:hypothetical protein